MNLYFPNYLLKRRVFEIIAYCCLTGCTLVFYSTANGQEKKTLEPDVLGMFYHLNTEGNSLLPLDKQNVKIKSRGFLSNTGYFEVKGEKSSVRLKTDKTIEFIVSLANGVDPNKFQLYELKLRKKNREAILGKATIKGSEIGAETISLTVKKYGESSYKFTLPPNIAPGEYGISSVKFESIFSEDAKEVFCFGIDK